MSDEFYEDMFAFEVNPIDDPIRANANSVSILFGLYFRATARSRIEGKFIEFLEESFLEFSGILSKSLSAVGLSSTRYPVGADSIFELFKADRSLVFARIGCCVVVLVLHQAFIFLDGEECMGFLPTTINDE